MNDKKYLEKELEAAYIKNEQRAFAETGSHKAGRQRLRLRTVSTALVVFMLALVVIFGSSAVSLSSSAYAVSVDGEQVAVLVSQQEADEAVELALEQEQQKWSQNDDLTLDYDNLLEIETVEQTAAGAYSSVSEAAGLLAGQLDFTARCVELFVEDEAVCYLASADQAIQAVNLVKSRFGVMNEDGVSAVYTQQRITFQEATAQLDQVLTVSDAARLLSGEEGSSPLLDVVVERTSAQVEVLPFDTVRVDDDTLPRGEEQVVTAGVDGTQEVTYLLTEVNGELTSRQATGAEVLTPAVDEVVNVGTLLMYNGRIVGELGWPLADGVGVISSRYGYRSRGWHSGVDVAWYIYTTIVAAESGTVTYAAYNPGGYGNLVIIDHGNGLSTYYAHCDEFYVSVGDQVERGQAIADIGMTGTTTGPHVHFEVRVDGSAIDPAPYIGAD